MSPDTRSARSAVAPHAGAWIETFAVRSTPLGFRVAPHAGAWIETATAPTTPIWATSRPSRRGVDRNRQPHPRARRRKGSPLTQGRGSKHDARTGHDRHDIVAPHAGAWIETWCNLFGDLVNPVAPHAGAWIETGVNSASASTDVASPLTQGRGSKPEEPQGRSGCPGRPSRRGVDRNASRLAQPWLT